MEMQQFDLHALWVTHIPYGLHAMSIVAEACLLDSVGVEHEGFIEIGIGTTVFYHR